MTWSIGQIVLTLEVNPSRFGFSKRKDHVVVFSTLAREFNTPIECRPDESGFKAIKEGPEAPNVNFRKISVRKTISELQVLEHFL